MATLDELLGRGFVRSGSGYVSTPTTRTAARAAGTYGAGGFAGTEQTAAQLSRTLNLRDRGGALSGGVDAAKAAQYRAESDALRRRVVAAKAAGLTLSEYDARQKCGAKPTTPPRYFADHNITPTPGHDWICRVDGWIWTMDAAEKVQVKRAEAASDAAPYTDTTRDIDKIPDITKRTGVGVCPRGLRYTKLTRWSACDTGYVSTKGSGLSVLGQSIYPLWPGNECVCVNTPAGQAIIKAESEPEPSDLPNGEGEGVFGDIFGEDTGKISGIVLLVVGGAIVVALLGMFKK